MKVKLLTETARLPVRGSELAAGSDIHADEFVEIPAGGYAAVSTGISVQAFKGHYIQVASRSGLMFRHGVMATAGVIDEDYTGEVKVILFNSGAEDFHVKVGDRIAQLIQLPVNYAAPRVVQSLEETLRGESGFGSTGV